MVLKVCSFESRRQSEMTSLIERMGAQATLAPSLREIPLESNTRALDFAMALFRGDFEIVIFLTGVGARALLDAVETRFPREQLFAALATCKIVVRGPKPAAVLKEWGVRIDHRVPEPNTWRELLETIDAELPVERRRVAVQEYGIANPELYAGLETRGAKVTPVPVYRWELPEDLGPLQQAIRQTCEGAFDILMWTSAQQVRHVLQVAADLGIEQQWRDAAGRCVMASIGPTCSDAIRDEGLTVDFEPSHPKMGSLVKETLAAAAGILATKRAG